MIGTVSTFNTSPKVQYTHKSQIFRIVLPTQPVNTCYTHNATVLLKCDSIISFKIRSTDNTYNMYSKETKDIIIKLLNSLKRGNEKNAYLRKDEVCTQARKTARVYTVYIQKLSKGSTGLTLFYYKNNVIRTKALILVDN